MPEQFYPEAIRQSLLAFEDVFDSITFQRADSSGTRVQTIAVPLEYASKEKWLRRVREDAELDRPIQVNLPRMSYELTGIEIDWTRKLTKKTITTAFDAADFTKTYYQYTPTPVNLTIDLKVYVRYQTDGLQILETIAHLFTPSFNQTIKFFPTMQTEWDVPILLQNATLEDDYEGEIGQRRYTVWNFSFLVKSYLFGPVRSKDLITTVLLRAREGASTNTDSAVLSQTAVTPGLLANGSPTTNASASVPVSQISSNSSYAVIYSS